MNTTTARRTYLAGSVIFIAIGVLHTVTQLTDLSTAEVEASFRSIGTIEVSGQQPEAWDLFQGTSYLMGFFALAIGVNNIAALRALGRNALPPVGVCLGTIGVLLLVTLVGVLFLGPLQMAGGPVGIALFALPVAVARRER